MQANGSFFLGHLEQGVLATSYFHFPLRDGKVALILLIHLPASFCFYGLYHTPKMQERRDMKQVDLAFVSIRSPVPFPALSSTFPASENFACSPRE